MKVPYVDLATQNAPLRDEILSAVADVLEHGMFILGPEVAAFEQALADKFGFGHVIGVGNGTDALVLALMAHGIGPGDEVLTVSHSFVATASAVRLVGADVRFVDIESKTMLLDPARIAEAVGPRTRAVMPVHLNGTPCEMEAITEVCAAQNLVLLEDCAQALGARYRGQSVGTFGTGCFSLHPLKVLSACGDAGFVTTSNAEFAETLRRLRNLGLEDRDHLGHISQNSRLDTLQAAILLKKLPHLDSWIAKRREHAAAYRAALHPALRRATTNDDRFEVCSTFVVRHPQRDEIVRKCHEQGVEVKVHYPIPIHRQRPFEDPMREPLPMTDDVVSQIISLPVTPEMTGAQRDYVISTLNRILEQL